jgi:intracellular septation protein A
MASPGLSPTETGPTPASSPAPHRPHLGEIVRRVSQSLLVACVVPIALFYAVFSTTNVWAAMGAALAWSYGAIAFRALTGRRTSGLLILTATVLTGRTVIALVANSTFLYFLQPIISDAVVGAAFLLSLASARPMVARLAGDFYPMDGELELRPRIQRLFRNLTIMWATLCLAKATFVLWLLHSQSLETFVLVQGVSAVTLNILATAATIAAAWLVGRKEGLLAPGRREPLPVAV